EYKTVRYIKSKDIARNSQEENIEWDLTSQLEISRHFLETEDPMNPPPNYSDCNHPAIVVRDDSLGNTFAYIVYTCKDTLSVALDSARVVEAKINVSSNAIVSNTQIYKLNDNDIETQGTPVINASANGNFIAWTVKN